MNLHLLELFRSQPAGFRNDMFGHGQLANVMQQRGRVQGLQLRPLHAQFFGNLDGVYTHPLQVIVRGLILGFNGQGQGFNGSKMQIRHFFDMPFFIFQLSEIETVRTVDQINGGNE